MGANISGPMMPTKQKPQDVKMLTIQDPFRGCMQKKHKCQVPVAGKSSECSSQNKRKGFHCTKGVMKGEGNDKTGC